MLELGHLHGTELPKYVLLLGSSPTYFSHGFAESVFGSPYVFSDCLKPTAGYIGKSSRTSAFNALNSNSLVAERLGITDAFFLNLAPRVLFGIAGNTAP